MKVKSESEVAQSCPTLSDPMDCSPPGSSVHGIFQARALEWGATAALCSSHDCIKNRFSQENSPKVDNYVFVHVFETVLWVQIKDITQNKV